MPGTTPDPYTLLESSFNASPNFRSHKTLPRRRDELYSIVPAAVPLKEDPPCSDDETESQVSSENHTLLGESPLSLNGAESGLPPTPPSNVQEDRPSSTFSLPPYADGVVTLLMSKKSGLSTPVNARSPPTPDPSPPRTTESMTLPERPLLFPYPSSRADSFKTAREDLTSSENGNSRSNTPFATPFGEITSSPPQPDRLSVVREDSHGLGLAFEREDSDATPTDRTRHELSAVAVDNGCEEIQDTPDPQVEDIPNREWDTNLMRNVTIRRKTKPSPKKKPVAPASPTIGSTSTPRRTSSLRERVEASKNSPHTPSFETFAQSIGWPTEPAHITPKEPAHITPKEPAHITPKEPAHSMPKEPAHSTPKEPTHSTPKEPAHSTPKESAHSTPKESAHSTPKEQSRDVDNKRFSGASMNSTVVEAMVIVAPPRQRRALRHSGKNLAYRAVSDSSAEHASGVYSSRNSIHSGDIPLHRLVHKTASINGRQSRASVGSSATGMDRYASPLSIRKRGEERSASTLAHQESLRNVLQPAADIMSRNSLSRPYLSERSYHKRIASAPEVVRRRDYTLEPRSFLELSPPLSPTDTNNSSLIPPSNERKMSSTSGYKSYEPSPLSLKVQMERQSSNDSKNTLNTNKSLPQLPEVAPQEAISVQRSAKSNESQPPTSRENAVISPDVPYPSRVAFLESPPPPQQELSSETVPTVRRGSVSIRGRSEERRRSSTSQDRKSLSRTSTSREGLLRPTPDRQPTEELPHHSYEWNSMRPDGSRRVSFDSSTIQSGEHAMARHLYAQTTPFSQTSAVSDTPIEVSEATAVSIYPHNNHSLLVVQQLSRASTLPPESRQIVEEVHYTTSDLPRPVISVTPPFVDADEHQQLPQPQGPALTLEPSTPPTNLVLPNVSFSGVDSPLTNPRPPPEPPIIQFIPPTPMEELERQLAPSPTGSHRPGPPKHSLSHPQRNPQRRMSLVQRARRYSGNIISPFLARANSGRGQDASVPHSHENPRIPSVADDDGSLHPFWRPRGFWDGFEDSDSDSDDALPQGGDTSDVEDYQPEPAPRKMVQLQRRLTNGFKRDGGGGFLIGNSVGIERSGTNKRRPHIQAPPRRISTEPKVLLHPPTAQTLSSRFGSRPARVEKRTSRTSLQSSHSGSGSGNETRRRERKGWKQGKSIPGLGMQVQYIGISGVKERLRERKAEKRRDSIRKSIGSRYYVEAGTSLAS
jgi:hypothetical protein